VQEGAGIPGHLEKCENKDDVVIMSLRAIVPVITMHKVWDSLKAYWHSAV
jgi:hypothetical protein